MLGARAALLGRFCLGEAFSLGEQLRNLLEGFPDIVGFADVAVGAELATASFGGEAKGTGCGADEDERAVQNGIGFDGLAHLVPVNFRHPEIEDDEVGTEFPDPFEGYGLVHGLDDVEGRQIED